MNTKLRKQSVFFGRRPLFVLGATYISPMPLPLRVFPPSPNSEKRQITLWSVDDHTLVTWERKGSPIYPTRNGSPKLGTVRDESRRPVTVCQFATCRRSSVVLHTYTNVCGVIVLERGILLHFFRLFICVVCGSSRPVTPLATRIGHSGADPGFFFSRGCPTTSTPINHRGFFCRIQLVLESHRSSQGAGRGRGGGRECTPAPSP